MKLTLGTGKNIVHGKQNIASHTTLEVANSIRS